MLVNLSTVTFVPHQEQGDGPIPTKLKSPASSIAQFRHRTADTGDDETVPRMLILHFPRKLHLTCHWRHYLSLLQYIRISNFCEISKAQGDWMFNLCNVY